MTATVPETRTGAAAAVTTWLSAFSEALAAGDPAAAAELFLEDCYWRDLVAFTWNIKTCEGRAAVTEMLSETLPGLQPGNWRITDGEEPADAGGVIEAWIDFETAVGRGHGQLRLRDGRCWTLLTTLEELKGHEEPRGPSRPKGAEHGASRGRTTWLEKREHEASELGFTKQPYVPSCSMTARNCRPTSSSMPPGTAR
jgi:putative flavoprotein involved in K+ transport